MNTNRSYIKMLLIGVICCLGGAFLAFGDAKAGEAAFFKEEFNGSTLPPSWTIWDGYALNQPGDLTNHAIFSMTGSHLSISFPGGVEHNMWWLQHAQVTRLYEGSGVYEIKVDSSFDGSQQFGLVFENSPGTFLIFMLYAHDIVWGYVERFTNLNGVQYRTTFPGPWTGGHNTGLVVPAAGPYWLRVIVADDAVLTSRAWKFQWSSDGVTWTTVADGVLEGPDAHANIGAIQRVGFFAGNQPYQYSPANARFDYYRTYPISALPVQGPTDLAATLGNQQVTLSWSATAGAQEYSIYRSLMAGGPYTFLGTSASNSYTDAGLTNGTMYAYVVAAHVNGIKSTNSNEVKAIPHALHDPSELPSTGRLLVLDADALGYQFFNGETVTHWPDAFGGPLAASTQQAHAPRFLTDAISGHSVVRFDGHNDYLNLSLGFEDFSAGISLFVVARPMALQTGSKLVLLGNGAGQANVALGRNGSSAGLQYFTTDSGGSYAWFATADALATNEAALYSVVQGGGIVNSPATATISKNGVTIGSAAVYVPPVVARGINYVGRSYWASDGYFAGDIAEIILYNRALSAVEQAAISTYLGQKYGLTVMNAPPTLLNPPGALSATAGNAHVSLSWSAVVGATGYKVYRRITPSGAYDKIHEGGGSTYTDAAVTNGTTYGYVVTAYDANQESVYSTEISVTPALAELDSPDAPSAMVGNAQVSLSWNSVSGATGYKLYRRTTPLSAFVKIHQGAGRTYTDSGVTNGTTYGYVVSAYDANQDSAHSPEILVTPETPPLLAPPREIPSAGLVLLLDGENAALSAPNGGEVVTWRDSSGHGRDAVTISGQAPTVVSGALGGKAVLRFDGHNDYLNLPLGFADFGAGISLFVIARPTALQTGSKLMLLGNGAGQANVALGRNGGSAALQYFTSDAGGDYAWFATADALATNEAAVYSVVQGGGAVNSLVPATVAKNGDSIGNALVYVPPLVARNINYIGRSYWGSDGYFAGDIAEIIFYDRALDAAEQAAVNAYLSHKYGLVVP